MRTNNSAVFLLLLLFFFFATAPPALVFAHYYGVLPLPQLDYGSVMVFATAALFLLPVFFVLLATVAVLLKKRKERGGVAGVVVKSALKPEHYPWEGVFRTAEKEEFKAARAKVKAAFAVPKLAYKLNATALLVVAVIVAATVVFFVIVVPTAKDAFTTGGKGSNLTNLTNLSAGVPDKVVKNESAFLNFFKTRLSSLRKTNETRLAEEAKVAEAKKLAEAAKKEVVAKQKQEKEAKQKEQRASSFSALAAKFTKFKAAALKASAKASAFWPYAVAGIGVLVLLGGGFYFYKTKKVKPAADWLRACAADSAGWLAVLFSDVKRNSLKLLIFAVVIAVAALAFAFRSWLKVKLSVIREPSVTIFYAAKNFLSAYRLYIIIGVAALLVVLCVLFLLERREKEKRKEFGTASTAPKKSSR